MIPRFFLFLLLAPCFSAHSQIQNLRFEHISTDAGLSQSNVICMLQDRRGFMWFGTRDGLNKYDGYKFTVYKTNILDPNSLSNDMIMDIAQDRDGNLWIATGGGGLNQLRVNDEKFIHFKHDDHLSGSIASDYVTSLQLSSQGELWVGTDKGLDVLSKDTKNFTHYTNVPENAKSLSENYVKDILEDSNQNLWVGTQDGGLNLFDNKSNTFVRFLHDANKCNSLSSNTVTVIFEDTWHRLWVGTRGGGLNLFNPTTNEFAHFNHDPAKKTTVAHDVILSLGQDSQNNLWVGTENYGLCTMDTASGIFHTFVQDEIDKAGLTSNSIWSIYKDTFGNMWIGTFNAGINLMNADSKRFTHYRHNASPFSLSHNNVLCIYEDSNDDMWVGTDGGGLNLFDRKKGTFKRLHRDGQGVIGDHVLKVVEDSDQNLWIGTWGEGITVFNKKRNSYKQFRHNPTSRADLGSNNAWTIFEDSDKKIWIGTFGDGLELYARETDSFVHFKYSSSNPAGIVGNFINCISEDADKNMWIGTSGDGLSRLNKQTMVSTHLVHDESRNSISNNTINSICIDKKNGKMWIGTDFGLNLLDLKTNHFTAYHVADGLPDEAVLGILMDNHENLWISTNHGLSEFNLSKKRFRNFTVSDGLQSNEFKAAYWKSRSGKMYFGGINGFNEFHPDSIKRQQSFPPLVLTGFQIFNKPVVVSKCIDPKTNAIVLSHDQSVMSFEFACLSFVPLEKKRYSYFLKGFDKDWNYIGTRHIATYTNLDPGDYTLQVKSQNNEGEWSADTLSIALTVTPAFWQTWWFKAVSILVVVGLIAASFVIRETMIRKQKVALVLQVKERTKQFLAASEKERHARIEAEKAHQEAEQASRAKSVFLATMSHELRTPMNGVIGMASLLAHTPLNDEQREYTDTIKTCSDSLLGVINDILDYSKIESGKLELEQKDFDLRSCVEEVLDMFAGKAAQTGLDLVYQLDQNVPHQIMGDGFRLRQVLTNLVGNAIKFTKCGEVFIGVHVLSMENERCDLSFEIRDTGVGIPEDKIERLFKAFSQVDSSTTRKYGGTGLGLAISEKLIQLMNGSITVTSKVEFGTTFKFNISVGISDKSIQKYIYPDMVGLEGKQVLVVDDNSTNLSILKNQLELWKLKPVLANSAEQALEILSGDFDLVITDMQMPEMDGVQLAQAIRCRRPDLPIVLLSSLGDERNKNFPGLFSSVLTKPVKQNLLSQHIQSELRKRKITLVQSPETTLQSDFSSKYPMRILVAEDNVVNQRLAERVLSKLGYTPQMVMNGKEAVEAERKNHFDLVFMDVQMPIMDGLEATRHIRSQYLEHPLIIAMTANAMQSDQEECLNAGMNDYISKPIKLEELVKLLKRWATYLQQNSRRAV